ncbi:MAG: MBL fold metallo-hydrolase [Gammaproteobacteria bacterium]|uniref:MBL fold metallo-hydrolase n=1 Tax=Limnobacter sp. TaxID=2003368 RepID=UPI001DE1BB7F|nr:MBL fold metallo-hydrolase [Limnobacter sp.]MBU0782899.1 MBL fold metallo-hydrolase [Gammaproteobacteria bacterium]MBU0849486.1 MBL fold metallo-hydrolase [Gammaproteobacteria bacterium]MBU1268099.1 MBL fold metallo-hydrolase [Gammaproteobacteria bacterium]MBU1528949.1 MBL fold metallo-hydrolase [Gammaproteobacteria bacterium]MBU1779493.1 MBL fold metallo-hydrolase [Gammaproteobacteria bacterium]
MRFASLGSGSEGNSWLFECKLGNAPTRLMVDCGFAVKETVSRLERVGVPPAQVDAIVVTHEHGDHISGVFKFSRKFGTPVYLTHGTWRAALRSKLTDIEYLHSGRVVLIESHSPFQIKHLKLHPFPVPHDAAEPVQLLIESLSGFIAGILTDCGSATPHLVGMLNRAHALILESNHCPEMLSNSPYPPSLKKRVGGDYGHLSNQVACEILRSLNSGNLKFVVAAHLSKTTNCPDVVQSMWNAVLQPRGIPFEIACQAEGVDWVTLDPAQLAA